MKQEELNRLLLKVGINGILSKAITGYNLVKGGRCCINGMYVKDVNRGSLQETHKMVAISCERKEEFCSMAEI